MQHDLAYDDPARCRCRAFLSTPCTARATQEDGLCDACRHVEQPAGPNRHEGNGGWHHYHH